MIEEKVIGFICKKSNYQDYDAIINLLTSQGKITFKAKGILKNNSKNAASCNYFMIGEYVYYSKAENSNKTLKTAHCLKIYKKPYEDLCVNASYLLICQLLDYFSLEINGYDMAIKCFDYLENGEYPLTVLNFFLKNLCCALGYSPDLSGCIHCHQKTKLISFDFEMGGFICKDCFKEKMNQKISSDILKDIYLLLNTDEFQRLKEESSLYIYKLYVDFFKNYLNLPFHNLNFVLECI